MNKFTRIVTTVTLAMVVAHSYAQTKYTMEDVLQMAKSQSPFSKQAETRKENRYWQYKFYKSDYNPQLRLSGNLPDYNQDYFQNTTDEGKIEFQSRERTNAIVNLGLQQPIYFTGGTISVNSNLNKINDFYYDYSTWNGTVVNVRLDQPILNFNQLRWNKMTEPVRYEESKRSYVEEMELISQQA